MYFPRIFRWNWFGSGVLTLFRQALRSENKTVMVIILCNLRTEDLISRDLCCETSLYCKAAAGDEEWATTRGLVLVARDTGHGSSGTPGIHIRGSPLRASVAGDPEVDLLLPGTAR